MADQIPDFIDGDTGIGNRVKAAWLNDVNDATYRANTGITGATPSRTLLSKLSDIISVKDFGAVGDGVTDDTAAIAAFAAALAVAPVKEGVFPAGTYNYIASPNWAVAGIALIALGKVVLNNTGTGNSMTFDGGAAGGGVYNVKMLGNFYVQGGATSLDAIYCRALHHSKIEATVLGAGTAYAGLHTLWSVLSEFTVKVSSNEGAWISQPANGYLLDQRGVGEGTASCNFYNPTAEGVSGSGIKISNGQGNNFFGGSSEGNNRGVEIATGGSNVSNKFYGLDTESNAVEDYLLSCFDNVFYGLKCAGLVHLANTSVRNHFVGGYLNSVTLDAPADHNSFAELTTGNAGGAITDNGVKTAFCNVYDATAGIFRNKPATSIYGIDSILTGAPRTGTGATDTITSADTSFIANRAGTITLTLEAASTVIGKLLLIRTIQAQTVISASSNVVPRAGGAAGTAILAATAGNWALLHAGSTNWEIMAGS